MTITAFERSPDGGQGLARDTRVRWALEEVGKPYAVRLACCPRTPPPGRAITWMFAAQRAINAPPAAG